MRGVVVGAFGVGSEYLHFLIKHLTISKVRERGEELAVTTSLLRRALSLVGVDAQARLMFDRLELLVLVLQRGGWKGKLCFQPGENLGKPEKG